MSGAVIVIIPLTPIPEFPSLAYRALGTYNSMAFNWAKHIREVFAGQLNALAAATQANAETALESAEVAIAQATAAQALVNADKWVPGTDYPADETAWSPANKQTYRRNVSGISNTDPSLDPLGWTRVGGGDVVPQFFFTAQGII